MSGLLDIVYASAPTDQVLIPTLEILHPAFDPIRICAGFEDITATLETGQTVTFLAGGIDISLPARDSTGQQNLTFAIDNVTGEAQRAVDAATDAGGQVTIIYRSYLHTDLSVPAEPPLTMTMAGAAFEGGRVQVQATYYDLLGTSWPRMRYTSDFSPGLKYFG